ncbi:MAG: amidohydrolase family protein [Lentisphaeria bacterium]|nr:amidohydrolase family protein [Lentisphaeria bacterium]
MIIDIHGHLGNINQAPFWAADAPELERYLDEAGVDRLCISAAKSLMYDAREGNADLDQALKASTRLLGYVTVNPMFPESMEDLALLESESKFIGVKIHPDYHGYHIKSHVAQIFLDQVARRVSLMLFHVSCMPGTGFADAERIAEFASRHPDTHFVLAHVAGIYQNPQYPYFPNLEGLEKVAAFHLENVYVDTAHYLMYVYPGVMEQMVATIGADHIVFGTDVPLQGPAQMRFALETIRALDIPDDDKDKILYANAAKLIGLERRQ